MMSDLRRLRGKQIWVYIKQGVTIEELIEKYKCSQEDLEKYMEKNFEKKARESIRRELEKNGKKKRQQYCYHCYSRRNFQDNIK